MNVLSNHPTRRRILHTGGAVGLFGYTGYLETAMGA